MSSAKTIKDLCIVTAWIEVLEIWLSVNAVLSGIIKNASTIHPNLKMSSISASIAAYFMI